MNDLSKKDSLPKAHKPLKWFIIYSLAIIVLNITALIVSEYFKENDYEANSSLLFASGYNSIILSVLATFFPKQQITVSKRSRNFGIALIYIGGLISFFTIAIMYLNSHPEMINYATVYVLGISILTILIFNLVSYLIVIVVLNLIVKSLNRKISLKNE